MSPGAEQVGQSMEFEHFLCFPRTQGQRPTYRNATVPQTSNAGLRPAKAGKAPWSLALSIALQRRKCSDLFGCPYIGGGPEAKPRKFALLELSKGERSSPREFGDFAVLPNRQGRGRLQERTVRPISNAGFQPAKSSASSTFKSLEGASFSGFASGPRRMRHSRKGRLEHLHCGNARNASVPPSSKAGFQPAKSSASSTGQSPEGASFSGFASGPRRMRHSPKGPLEDLRCYGARKMAKFQRRAKLAIG